MIGVFWNILIFILSTVAYFTFLKPQLTLDIVQNESSYRSYISSTHTMVIVYILGIILSQFFINSAVIINTCGGSSSKNIGTAALLTFIPWTCIFGIVVAILIIFPGFKSAFSDVVGYFWVANKANAILSKLLVDPNISKSVDSLSPTQKQSIEDAASVIVKMSGNMAILINQIVPENFTEYWNILTPLMKEGNQDTAALKQELFSLVVTRDNIGEGFWYFYTALLLISIVQFNIVNQGCSKDMGAIKQNLNQYLDNQEKEEQKKQATNVKYSNQ